MKLIVNIVYPVYSKYFNIMISIKIVEVFYFIFLNCFWSPVCILHLQHVFRLSTFKVLSEQWLLGSAVIELVFLIYKEFLQAKSHSSRKMGKGDECIHKGIRVTNKNAKMFHIY